MPGNEVLRESVQNVARFVNAHRLLLYSLASIIALAGVITNALKNYSNFYSVAIYLSKSSRSVLALANFAFLIALLCGHLIQRLFFGTLRANEVERLYDRLWFFITESLLAFTIFRDEFDMPFAFMFGFLLFVKSFHWLSNDRIEWMDQRPYPGPPLIFHLRMTVLFLILWATDCLMFIFTVEHTISVGVGGMVLFASEYGILIASVMNTLSKYLLSAYELRRAGQRGGENAPPWENKSMWIFYIELATDFMKLTIYLIFFTIIITFYGLPLNIVRDVYVTARSFISRLRALHRYQTATRNMDQRYPNASEEELSAMSDRTCIICREEMVSQDPQTGENRDGPNMTPKKLPCGHIFHFSCLRSWLERQQSCPTCRRTVLDEGTPPNPQAANNPPPPPAPAAVPQAPNAHLGVAPNANQQGGNNNPFGNPLGFVNRLFGPPQGQNNVGGHQNPFIPNQGVFANPGNPGQNPPAILIQYEIQYQGPRPQGANVLHGQHQPQALNPVPQFPGFVGPDGRWQPWPGGRALDQQQDPNAAQPPPLNPSSEQVLPAAPSVTTRHESETSSDNFSDSDSMTSGNDQEEPQSTRLSPREAARAAVLRRLGGSSTAAGSIAVNPSSSTKSPITPAPITSSTANRNQESSSPPQQQTPQSISQPSQGPAVPSLIPLYDLNGSHPYIPPASIRSPSFATYGPLSGRQAPHANAGQAPSDRPNAYPTASQSYNGIDGQSSSSDPRRSTIPSHVTAEQLATMDRLTREAIDERLRVLESVSNTLYTCIDDLMRMRSALPSCDVITAAPTENAGTPVELEPSHRAVHGVSRRDEKRPEMPEEKTANSSTHDLSVHEGA